MVEFENGHLLLNFPLYFLENKEGGGDKRAADLRVYHYVKILTEYARESHTPCVPSVFERRATAPRPTIRPVCFGQKRAVLVKMGKHRAELSRFIKPREGVSRPVKHAEVCVARHVAGRADNAGDNLPGPGIVTLR